MVNYFDRILQRELKPEVWEWLTASVAKLQTIDGNSAFLKAFTAMPRHTGKSAFALNGKEIQEINGLLPGFTLRNYTLDRLARVWLLLHFASEEQKNEYINTIGQLFKAAEMNEMVALYGALPLLSYPQEWVKQCVEGIRSNIGLVLEAIMCDNPFPSLYLDQAAWNQLVLKAFFTEKPVNRIIGLDQRANQRLAFILVDYAHERWAAGRTVDPQLWRLVASFVDERIFKDLKKVYEEGTSVEKTAAALACFQSNYLPAKSLLNQDPDLTFAIERNKVNWDHLCYPVQAG